MRVETIPLILGALVGLIGLGLLADAWLPEHVRFRSERRRRARTERSLGGEAHRPRRALHRRGADRARHVATTPRSA